ncbi:MAG: hypothetical protein FRX49_05094 [Trebouxia sp. A1-2]|nr:MAG: hypothetical protein FRX49_05094 [Trebouxia sp. A1-2]
MKVFQNTYEGKSTKPNSLVAQFGTNPKWIEKAGCPSGPMGNSFRRTAGMLDAKAAAPVWDTATK